MNFYFILLLQIFLAFRFLCRCFIMDASDINKDHDDIKVESESDENAEPIMCEFCCEIFDAEK